MKRALVVLAGVLTVTQSVWAFDHKAHYPMTTSARERMRLDADIYGFDDDFKAFLEDYGEDIDSRAGDKDEHTHTDEDHNEGSQRVLSCRYLEHDCGLTCTLDHFQPRFAILFGNAVDHANYYFNIAVKQYKAAKCHTVSSMERTYYESAARALGHALHLAEDMGVPEHTRPEGHLPFIWMNSFYEAWAGAAWGQYASYTTPDGTVHYLANFQHDAAQATTPIQAGLASIMDYTAHNSRYFHLDAPFPRGTEFTEHELVDFFQDSNPAPWWSGYTDPGHVEFGLTRLMIDRLPPYATTSGIQSGRVFFHSNFGQDYDLLNNAKVAVSSCNLEHRLWAEPNPAFPQNPIEFDEKMGDRIKATTRAAAGVIWAFWQEVQGWQCPCQNFSPCDFAKSKNGGEEKVTCNPPPAPGGPNRNTPDDNAAVVAVSLNPSSMSEVKQESFSSLDAANWRQITRVGVDKGDSLLVDFGRLLWAIETVPEEADLSADSLAELNAMVHMLSTSSQDLEVDRQRYQDRAAHIAVLDAGFASGATEILDRLDRPHTSLSFDFNPLDAAAEYRVLLVPSGALYGTQASADLRQRFQAYVENGGMLVVMAQMNGVDLDAVPTPEGEELSGRGWFEDQSCWRDSVRITAMHPVTASARDEELSAPVDGFIERWPAGGEVLLRRTANGTAAMVHYGLGAGRVVVTSLYEDWATASGTTSQDGLELLANLLSWGIGSDAGRVECELGACSPSISTELVNLTESDADTIEWQLVAPTGGEPLLIWQEPVTAEAGTSFAASTVVPNIQFGPVGIYQLRYSLLDSEKTLTFESGATLPWVAQPAGAAAQILVQDWPTALHDQARVALSLTVDSEIVANHSVIPVHVGIENLSDKPFSGRLNISQGWRVVSSGSALTTLPVELAPGAQISFDPSVGPLHLRHGHDGGPGGGWLFAALVDDENHIVESTSKAVITNVRFMNVEMTPLSDPASPGEQLAIHGVMGNQSPGLLEGRYKLVYRNWNNPGEPAQDYIEGEWKEFSLAAGGAFSLTEPFDVPSDWQGQMAARLHLCYPDLRCWDQTGVENATTDSWEIGVNISMTQVALEFGTPSVVDGSTLRVSVHLENGNVAIQQGQLKIWQGYNGAPDAPLAFSDSFDLAAGGSLDLDLEIPLDARMQSPYWQTHVAFTDPSWQATDTPWAFQIDEAFGYGAELNLRSPLEALPGETSIRGQLALTNRSSFARTFSVHLQCAGLGWEDTRNLTVASRQMSLLDIEIPLPAATPYDGYPLVVHLEDGAGVVVDRELRAWYLDPKVKLMTPPTPERPKAGSDFVVEVSAVAERQATALPGFIELISTDLALNESRPVTLAVGERALESFTISLAPDLSAGIYDYDLHWREANGHEIVEARRLHIRPARVTATLQQTTADAGDELIYGMVNSGCAAGTGEVVWQLREGTTIVVEDQVEVNLAPDASDSLSFTLPASLRSGNYISRISFLGATQYDALSVTGVDAQLEVGTEQPVFIVTDTKTAWAEISNGDLPLANATLRLEVLGEDTSCGDEVDEWGVYQGSPSRTGYCPTGGALFPSDRYCYFVPLAIANPAEEIFASAAADLDGDGNDDIVALEGQTSIDALTIFGGPDLALRGSLALPVGSTTGALVIGVSEDDGQAIIYLSYPAGATTLTVAAYSDSLGALWQTSVAAAGATEAPFPAGGPFMATLDGESDPVVVIASGSDVLALRTADGSVLWQLSATGALSSGWIVTGTAGADTDGDGFDEIAVGLSSTDAIPTGRILLVEGTGLEKWSWPTTDAIVGAPVMVLDGVAHASIVAVQTPPTSDEWSTMTLLSAAAGTQVWQTNTEFWARFQPAAADLDGDGLTEYAVGSGDPDCSWCSYDGVIVIDDDGSVMWWGSNHPVPAAPPIAMDIYGQGDIDLVVYHEGGGYSPEINAWQGESMGRLGWGEADRAPLYVLDVDGDCQPEIASGGTVLIGEEMGPEEKAAVSIRSQVLERAVLWSWEGPVALAADEFARIDQNIEGFEQTGFFQLRGVLLNELGQTIAEYESPFSVVDDFIDLTLDGLENAYAVDSPISVHVGVQNTSSYEEYVTVSLNLDDESLLEDGYMLAAGELVEINHLLTENPDPGVHRLSVEVNGYYGMAASGARSFLVEVPDIELSVNAPAAVGTDAFQIEVEVGNMTQLPLDLELALSSTTSPDVTARPLHLEAGEHSQVVFDQVLHESTTFFLDTTGEVAEATDFVVSFDAIPGLELLTPLVMAAGPQVVRIRAANTGNEVLEGDLSWQMVGGAGESGLLSLRLAGLESEEIDLSVDLAPGPSTLHLELLNEVIEIEIEGHVNGKGSIAFAVAETVSSGPVTVGLSATNLLETAASFEVEVEILAEATQSVVHSHTLAYSLDGGETAQEDFEVILERGTYTLSAVLNGDASTLVQQTLTTLPRRQLSLSAEFGPVDLDGLVPLVATLGNGGSESAAVMVEVTGPQGASRTPVELDAGVSLPVISKIDPGTLTVGSHSFIVAAKDGAGAVDATAQADLMVTPASLSIANAPTAIQTQAGAQEVLQFVIANTGLQPATAQLSLDFSGSTVFGHDAETLVVGGATQLAEFVVDLPDELPTTTVEGSWRLFVQIEGEAFQTLDTGVVSLLVSGLGLEVDAVLDSDHADAGETVTLSLGMQLLEPGDPVPMFAFVSYGSFSERRDLSVESSLSTEQFTVPIDEPGKDISYGLYWPSGRAAYLSQRTIHPASGEVVISANQTEYLPGDQIILDVSLPTIGTLELFTMEQAEVLTSSGPATFEVPSTMPYGVYPIIWSFYGENGLLNGEFAVRVRGSRVRITNVDVPRTRVAVNDVITVRSTVTSDTDLDTTVKVWLQGPSGEFSFGGSSLATLEAEVTRHLSMELPIVTGEAGTHYCIVAVYDSVGTLLSNTAAMIDVGPGSLLGLTTEQTLVQRFDPVVVRIGLQGEGTGQLTLLLDQVAVYSTAVSLDGITRETVVLVSNERGLHNLAAELDVGGLVSRAETSFTVVALELVFADDFETNDTGAWSVTVD